MRPKAFTVACTQVSMSASRLTSVATKRVVSPSSATSVMPPVLSMSAMTTFAPSATKARAMAAPMRVAPPLTITTLSLSPLMSVP